MKKVLKYYGSVYNGNVFKDERDMTGKGDMEGEVTESRRKGDIHIVIVIMIIIKVGKKWDGDRS